MPITKSTRVNTDLSIAVSPTPFSQDYENFQVNLLHMRLFSHAASGKLFNEILLRDVLDETLNSALACPFLLHGLLAFSALHLSALYAEEKHVWDVQATGLQSTALQLFNASHNFEGDKLRAAFIFSSIIGKHVLARSLLQTDPSFDTLVEGLVEFLKMQLGVKTVIGSQWDVLINSDALRGSSSFRETLTRFQKAAGDPERHELSGDLLPLAAMIDASRLDAESKEEYRSMARKLDICMSSHVIDLPDSVFAWPTMLTQTFVDDLTARRPEALVILANYGVLIHRHRNLWMFGSGGKRLVESICRYLGKRWDETLRFPMSQAQHTD